MSSIELTAGFITLGHTHDNIYKTALFYFLICFCLLWVQACMRANLVWKLEYLLCLFLSGIVDKEVSVISATQLHTSYCLLTMLYSFLRRVYSVKRTSSIALIISFFLPEKMFLLIRNLGLIQDKTADVSNSWQAELEVDQCFYTNSSTTFFACKSCWMNVVPHVFILKSEKQQASSFPWSLLAFFFCATNKTNDRCCIDEPIFFIDSMNCDK